MINRRRFMQGAMGGLMALGLSGFSRQISANAITNKKLVVLQLMGGCDTANAFVPWQENNYYDIRPTIAIPEQDVIPLGGSQLGLHPALSPLQDIWNAGNLALFPATHCGPNPNRSHFFQFDFFDRGHYTSGSNASRTGWLAQYLITKQAAGLGALDFNGTRELFTGGPQPFAISGGKLNLDLGGSPGIASSIRANLFGSFSNKPDTHIVSTFSQTQQLMWNNLQTLEAIDLQQSAQNGAVYSESALNQQLKQTAIILRNLPELDVVHLTKGGWDTHKNQGGSVGRQANLLADLAGGLRAFYDDLGAERDNVLVVVGTEFSRTAAENGSAGTDHGMASAWFVLGGNTLLGGEKGDWPGFSTSDLVSGRFTAQATDYRDVLAQILHRHMGLTQAQAESCFPEYSYSEPVQFIV